MNNIEIIQALKTEEQRLKAKFPGFKVKIYLSISNQSRANGSQYIDKSREEYIKTLAGIVAECYSVDCKMFLSHEYTPELNDLRKIFWNALRKKGVSFTGIGRAFDRNHATIMHGCKSATDLADTEEPMRKKQAEVDNIIHSYFKN